jgi:hypothetical protein
MSYRPNESSTQIYAEGAWLQGAIVTGVFYGVVIVLSAMCWRSLWPRAQYHSTGYKKNRFLLCYVAFLFVVGTIYVAFNAQITQMGFIDNRLYPGGNVQSSNASSRTYGLLRSKCIRGGNLISSTQHRFRCFRLVCRLADGKCTVVSPIFTIDHAL